MGKHREPTKWFAGRIEMGKHFVYTCDRCHVESKAAMTGVTLPTGKDGVPQRWDMCDECRKQHGLLLADQLGQLRAFVAGVTLGPEANLPSPPPPNAAYAQQAQGLQGLAQVGPGGYFETFGGKW